MPNSSTRLRRSNRGRAAARWLWGLSHAPVDDCLEKRTKATLLAASVSEPGSSVSLAWNQESFRLGPEFRRQGDGLARLKIKRDRHGFETSMFAAKRGVGHQINRANRTPPD